MTRKPRKRVSRQVSDEYEVMSKDEDELGGEGENDGWRVGVRER